MTGLHLLASTGNQPVLAAATLTLGGLNLIQRRRLNEARRDPITGLPTRAAWCHSAARAIRRPAGLILLAIDGDGFKTINDTHGHDAGDAVIAALGARLAAWIGPRGMAGRIGGDEFIAWARPAAHEPVSRLLDGLVTALSAPVVYKTQQLPAAASVGAVLAEQLPTPSVPQAMKAADVALYAAKAAGRRTWRLATPPVHGYPIDSTPRVRDRDLPAADLVRRHP